VSAIGKFIPKSGAECRIYTHHQPSTSLSQLARKYTHRQSNVLCTFSDSFPLTFEFTGPCAALCTRSGGMRGWAAYGACCYYRTKPRTPRRLRGKGRWMQTAHRGRRSLPPCWRPALEDRAYLDARLSGRSH